MKTSVEML